MNRSSEETLGDAPEYRQLSKLKALKANKNHPCADCPNEIQAGQTYYRETFLYDGKFTVRRSHSAQGLCAYEQYQ